MLVYYQIALAEYSQTSTHVAWYQSIFSLFALFHIGKITHQQLKG